MCITGHIYKIIHLDSEIQYIGSTCDSISGRWRGHKNTYNSWLNNKKKNDTIAIYPFFDKYGIDRFKMILVKSYDVIDKKHLRVYEQIAINRTKCCNTNAAIQLIHSSCLAKHYRMINKQAISKTCKFYYEQNKQSIVEKKKLYRVNNKESISERKKQHYEQNKQAIAEKRSIKIQCECGAIVCKVHLNRHKITAKHINTLAQT